MPKVGLAFDRASVRTVDQDGRLHVEITNISKAAVNPYVGSEIPDGKALGLDPNRIYQLFRDPEELEKGAATFNNIQVIDAFDQTGKEHIPVSAADPKKAIICGSTGTDAVFQTPFLRNSMVIWDKKTIDGIESEERMEISCAYYYRADMTPGTFNGIRYDGVMRDIRGNHVAIVASGRAGADVVVGDSLPKEITMTKKALSRKAAMAKGALLAHLAPKMAADAKLDLNSILEAVTSANWKDQKTGIAAAIKPKLAKDADIAEVIQLLDKLDGEEAEDPALDADDPGNKDPAKDADPAAEIIAKLKEFIEGLCKPKAEDDAIDPVKKPNAGEPDDKKDEVVSKTAMDAAISVAVKANEAATIARLQGIAQAEEAVKPYVGKLAIAMDSADAVYGAALGMLKIDVKDVHPSAFKAILLAQPKPGDVKQNKIAEDSKMPSGLAELCPNLYRMQA